MSDDIIKRLREAIAARPTPGPWKIRAERYRFIHVYATGGGICQLDTVDGEGAANAKLIAAASPDNIRALLDRLDAAERENERLRRSQSRRVGYVCEQCGWTLSAEPPKRDERREG